MAWNPDKQRVLNDLRRIAISIRNARQNLDRMPRTKDGERKIQILIRDFEMVVERFKFNGRVPFQTVRALTVIAYQFALDTFVALRNSTHAENLTIS